MRNLMIKRWLAFPEIRMDYEEVYAHYRDLYHELLPCFAEGENGDPQNCGIYLRMKEGFNFIKERFHHDEYDIRTEVLDHEFEDDSLHALFTQPIREYSEHVLKIFMETGEDETQSANWAMRFGILCQTRMLGKYPQPLGKVVVNDYLKKISTPVEIPKEEIKNSYVLMNQWMEESVLPPNLLNEEFKFPDENLENLRKKCLSSMSLRIKYTASTDFPRSEGGKAREAQLLFYEAQKAKQMVPRRNLDTGEVESMLHLTEEPGEGFYAEYLFWLSVQIILNKLASMDVKWEKYKYPLFEWKDPFRTRIEAINEPGKMRMLVKTTSVLYWALTPMGEICNEALSFVNEHGAGLKSSAQAWKFQKELSGKGAQSSMIYDKDWLNKGNLFFGFLDWTEATDFIPRVLGITILEAFSRYLGVGNFYRKFCMTILLVEFPVDRVTLSVDKEESNEKILKIAWKGNIKAGFMMGMPVTKTVLHLCHSLTDIKAKRYFSIKGWDKKLYNPIIGPIHPGLGAFSTVTHFR
jgi:hypothetical protein